MRVVCQSIDEFLDNLRTEGAGTGKNTRYKSPIYREIVYLSRFERPIDEARTTINVQVSAIVDVDASSQYLIQAGEDCGIDYLASDEELLGSESFDQIKERIVQCCADLGLTIRPGVVDF